VTVSTLVISSAIFAQIKERVHSVNYSLPFKRMPGRMIIEKCFPGNDGVSDDMSPRSIVTGSTIDRGVNQGNVDEHEVVGC
jgi:hypothetical protein